MKRSGFIIQSTGSWYRIRDDRTGQETEGRIRGRLRLQGRRSTNPVVVGDRIMYETDASGESVITEVLPRRNYIIRRASNLSKESHILAANIDQAILVATLFNPETSYEFIDRFLVTCEAYHIPATIVLNKTDLAAAQPQALAEFLDTYALAGYPVIQTDALGGQGIGTVKNLTKNKTTLVAGNSGVGKSTLIRAIEPSAQVRTGEISGAHHKGKHTTTFSRVYPLTGGGYIIDTPGIKGFGLIDIGSEETCRYFPDLNRYASGCRYYNCTHTHEPDCAVEKAVETGKIAMRRYESYLKMLDDDEKYR